ncbi:MAG: hypothetical protein H0U95_06500 [Bacteroidetes bacterium]|nr:hypothetical protein [Bacteroidota bacterium]
MKKKVSFLFWQKWLFYTSILFALFGISFALFGNNIFFRPYNQMLAKVFWNQSEIPSEVESFRAFIWGPLGATIACCYILLAYIAYYPFKRKERWAQKAIIAAFGIWVVLDSVVCIKFEVYFQIYLINAFSIIIKALPLIFTWNDFKEPNSKIST